MKNVYIDFDGVIVDTIRVTYDMLDRLGVDKNDFEKMSEFYSNLNWKQLLKLTSIINDGFNCIKKIVDTNKFNVSILTHVNSLDEAIAKINFIRKYLLDVTIIPVPREVSKTKMCLIKNSILIDDYSGNLKEWEKEGGIGVKFSTDKNKTSDYIIINKLDEIIDKF